MVLFEKHVAAKDNENLIAEFNYYKAPMVNFEYYFIKNCVAFLVNGLGATNENRLYNKLSLATT